MSTYTIAGQQLTIGKPSPKTLSKVRSFLGAESFESLIRDQSVQSVAGARVLDALCDQAKLNELLSLMTGTDVTIDLDTIEDTRPIMEMWQRFFQTFVLRLS